MKKIVIMLAIIVMGLIYSNAYAEDITVRLNGDILSFDQPPVVHNGRTLLSIRGIFEELGATISWDNKTKTATGLKGDKKFVLKLDNKNAEINGKTTILDVPVKMVGGRTFAPARFVAESFGATVKWDAKTSIMDIQMDIDETILYPIRQNGKWGYMDKSGKILIEPQYNNAYIFKYGLGVVQKNDAWGTKWGIIDKSGKIVVPFEYEQIESTSEHFFVLKSKNLWGLYNVFSHKIIAPKYDFIGGFSEGMAFVSGKTKEGYTGYGYINRSGQEIIPLQNELVSKNRYSSGCVLIEKKIASSKHYHDDYKYTLVNQQNKTVVDYDKLGCKPVCDMMYDGYIAVATEENSDFGKLSYVDKSGKIVKKTDLKVRLNKVLEYKNGLANIEKDGCYGKIDTKGNVKIDFENIRLGSASDGMISAEVYIDNKALNGFIDFSGKKVIEPKYNNVRDFCNGYAFYSYNRIIWGVIDKTGKEITPEIYRDISDFNKYGLAVVKDILTQGVVNSKGELILDFKYNDIELCDGGLIRTFEIYYDTGKKITKYSYYDDKGTKIWSE